ncbi:Alpha-tubulin N-acetyltransferase [Acropora cervicornis]|uniref:Alpha-tubulin N-acetyltransferase n=1 Tax=Acropora cervicornis TaxID=6130 RepID=A0AAD9QDF8_ACRCE|nr:Alpha-tubulin N-acetyltransferase [Acropora cervicornis]
MEFSFNVNELLPDLITLVDDKLAPFRSRVKNDRLEFASKQNQLKTLIDKMGEASTRHSGHRLYILKDPTANNGFGAAVGILKVGLKKLFLLDLQSVQYEVNPVCVLDFYVHESRQRTGCGKRLFEHMMKANNFVIHEHFFSDLQGESMSDPPILQRRPSASSSCYSTRPNSGQNISSLINNVETKRDELSKINRANSSLQHINLPPVLPRLSSRNSTPGSRGSSAERGSFSMKVDFGNKETTNHVRSGPSNASRGLTARATSYSRHSNRGESAKTRSSERFGEAMVSSPDNNIGFERNKRGGRIKSLHVTSAESPFAAEQLSTRQEVATKEQSLEETPHARTGVDQAHEQTTEVPPSSGLNSAGNFSVDTLFNARLGVRRPPFMGTSWNIFGVPTYTNPEPTSDDSLHTRRTRNRDHRY